MKNERRLKHINDRIRQLEFDLTEMKQTYSESEYRFWAAPSIDELARLRIEATKYQKAICLARPNKKQKES